MRRIVVIGAGAAGMMAAYSAAEAGAEVLLLEKNEKLGKKLFLTGKGRCNVTNACGVEELFQSVARNEKFLYSAFYAFSNQAVMDFFERAGCRLKTERGNRVFPVSDHSSDIIRALERKLKEVGVKVRLHTKAEGLLWDGDRVTGVLLADGREERADAVIVAAGGFSYPSTGSDGDGYRMAKECGHRITRIEPSLVPFVLKENYGKRLQGLALKNVEGSLLSGKNGKTVYRGLGEMLFTHFGISGPLVLSASSYYTGKIKENTCYFKLDLKPALSIEQLDKRILRDFETNKNRQFKNALGDLFPSRLIPVMIELSGILPEKPVNEITRGERAAFVSLIKDWRLEISGVRDFNEAIVTRGGICVKEVNPSTMESKIKKNLYFAGEVLDLDALTGGFNLQIAWSTGYLAGRNAATEEGL